MGLNSSVYDCHVMHYRLSPKKNAFGYKLFTFSLDLDELSTISKKIPFFSYRKWNLFSFYEEDHLNYGKSTQKENVQHFLKSQNFSEPVDKIFLVTHVRVLGYVFNPVCFYYCQNTTGETIAVVVEVHNTFGEMKPYLLTRSDLDENGFFSKRYTKFFYVSPFEDLDTDFEFRVGPLDEKFRIDIDDFKEDNKIFLSTYKGKREALEKFTLLKFFFKYPLVTLRVIFLIHLQAFKLILKKLPFHRKLENPELQKGVYLGKNHI